MSNEKKNLILSIALYALISICLVSAIFVGGSVRLALVCASAGLSIIALAITISSYRRAKK